MGLGLRAVPAFAGDTFATTRCRCWTPGQSRRHRTVPLPRSRTLRSFASSLLGQGQFSRGGAARRARSAGEWGTSTIERARPEYNNGVRPESRNPDVKHSSRRDPTSHPHPKWLSGSAPPRQAVRSGGPDKTPPRLGVAVDAFDPVEQPPVGAQHRLGLGQQVVGVGTVEAFLDQLPLRGRVLVVEPGVQFEVLGRLPPRRSRSARADPPAWSRRSPAGRTRSRTGRPGCAAAAARHPRPRRGRLLRLGRRGRSPDRLRRRGRSRPTPGRGRPPRRRAPRADRAAWGRPRGRRRPRRRPARRPRDGTRRRSGPARRATACPPTSAGRRSARARSSGRARPPSG